MAKYIIKGMLYLIPILIGVSVISFGLSHISKGDLVGIILREKKIKPTK